jgi:assimilatory nitrate reductase catalytic subunit
MHPCDMRHRSLDSRRSGARHQRPRRNDRTGQPRRGSAKRPRLDADALGQPVHEFAGCQCRGERCHRPLFKATGTEACGGANHQTRAALPAGGGPRCDSQAGCAGIDATPAAPRRAYPYATVNLYGAAARWWFFVRRPKHRSRPLDRRTGPVCSVWQATKAPSSMRMHGAHRQEGHCTATATAWRAAGRRDPGAQTWLKQAMAEDELDASLIRFALAPSAKPPVTSRRAISSANAPMSAMCRFTRNWPAGHPAAAAGQAEMRHLLRFLRPGNQAHGGRMQTKRRDRAA